MIQALAKLLRTDCGYNVTVNEHSAAQKLDDSAIVSDLAARGPWKSGQIITFQFDTSLIDPLRKTHSDLVESDYLSTSDPEYVQLDINAPLRKRYNEKQVWYRDSFFNNADADGTQDLIMPMIASINGALYAETSRFLRDLAEIMVNYASSPHCRPWEVPHDHILVSLLAQQFRMRISVAILRAKLHWINACLPYVASCRFDFKRRKGAFTPLDYSLDHVPNYISSE